MKEQKHRAIRRALFGLIMGLLLIPIFAFTSFAADKGTASNPITVSASGYSDLTSIVKNALSARTTSFTVCAKKSGTVNLTTVMASAVDAACAHTGKGNEGDYLRYNIDSTSYKWAGPKYDSSTASFYYVLTYNISYHDTAAKEATMAKKVTSVLTGQSLSGKTQYQKIKAIYDYMATNIKYDYSYSKYGGYDALCGNSSVCQGYASAFYRLCLTAGIKCRVVTGVSVNTKGGTEEHAWNIVQIGTNWYNVDITWDSVYKQAKQDYKYFLKSNGDFSGHSRDSEFSSSSFNSSYPMASKSYNSGSNKTYKLTINGGSGSGTYSSGTVVTIKANAAPAGKAFSKWIGTATYNGGTKSTQATAKIRVNKNTTLTASYAYADAGIKAGSYKIASTSASAKKTLQIKGNSKKNNAAVVAGKKSAKTATFQVSKAGSGYYYLVNKKTKKYLNLSGASAVQGKKGSTSKWRIVKSSAAVYRLINQNGKALTLSGVKLISAADTNKTTQQFRIGK